VGGKLTDFDDTGYRSHHSGIMISEKVLQFADRYTSADFKRLRKKDEKEENTIRNKIACQINLT
jgi:hypothetical protein